ncbi:DNA polymerase I [candidate division LCP-89 bacterium B3_LCP]|uniref:DNA polymerase I n=1 Tax=candidate division LCP-89 bacterium B3_LCP TaxID=2012998 RepID=A0A532UTS9_UNCL8|nr:MAG: DNA polymerase I [candidate division LCP-89 bacterium B3_LCP]
MPTLYLIDGSALAYRSHYAFSRTPLTSPSGQPTGATFGVALFVNSLTSRPDLTHAVCIFDAKGPTFRHEIYPEYKATRQKMPSELADQLPGMKEMIKAMGIPTLEKRGFEADDLIGTIAIRAAAEGFDVFIVSGDKDFGQLVSSKIHLLIPKGKGEGLEIFDEAAVEAKWGVPPEKIIDFMGLKGDSSDNVPGVPIVGDKTAAQLINQFGSLDEVLSKAEEVTKPALRRNLIDYAEQARLSRRLVTIDTSVPVSMTSDEFTFRIDDTEKLADIYREYGFHSLLAKLDAEQVEDSSDLKYKAVTTEEELDTLIDTMKKVDLLSVDLETTSTDPMQAEIVGFSFSFNNGEGFYIPACLGYFPGLEGETGRLGQDITAETRWVLNKLRPLYENSTIRKCGQNLKYDALVLHCHGIKLKNIASDSMVASYVLDPTRRQHNIDSLALEHLNFKKIPTSDLIGTGKKQISMADVPLEKITPYACEDADIARRLCILFQKQLHEGELANLYRDLELPLIPVLMEMEYNGVALNVELLESMSVEMGEKLDGLTEEIYRLAGTQFNINSTKQLQHILFDKLQLKPVKKTKTGYSTDVEVLEKLASQDPLPKTLLEYRQLQKLKSTYVDSLPKMINPVTGRVHTSFNQVVAATGRLSSSDPNLQNIPIRTEIGGAIRRAFIPEKQSQVLLSADYSQIELRIVAHISGDEELIAAFHEGRDVHASTAARIMNVPVEMVTPEMRRSAKEINFGVIYGMGDWGLSERLGIPVNVAADFRKQYFETYPGVRAYMDGIIEQARRENLVTTMMGRRRFLPEIDSTNRNIREFAERTAINTPIQGSAADMIKMAMVRIHERIKELPAKMILQVHDELVFEVEREAIDEVKTAVKEEMENAMKLKVPVVVDLGVGENWLEAH